MQKFPIILLTCLVYLVACQTTTNSKNHNSDNSTANTTLNRQAQMNSTMLDIADQGTEIRRRIDFLNEQNYRPREVARIEDRYAALKIFDARINQSISIVSTGGIPDVFSPSDVPTIEANGSQSQSLLDTIAEHVTRWENLMAQTDDLLLARIDSLNQ